MNVDFVSRAFAPPSRVYCAERANGGNRSPTLGHGSALHTIDPITLITLLTLPGRSGASPHQPLPEPARQKRASVENRHSHFTPQDETR